MDRFVIAVDVDGTLYDGVTVAPEAVVALGEARDRGHHIVIVTGRRWESVVTVVPAVVALCERVVCEEGSVLVNTTTAIWTALAEPCPPPLLAELIAAVDAAGVGPLDIGHVTVGALIGARSVVDGVLARHPGTRVVVTNKGSIAVVPPEWDKGRGFRAAVADLALGGLPVLAIGDAQNDLPLFAAATIAIAVANADDAVRAAGVLLTAAGTGLGVAEAVNRFVLGARSG